MTFARPFSLFVAGCLAFGLLYRFYPLAAGPEALAQAFITEDGYLMLTVARNLAMGLGLSVSAGEIATNGVQPLATMLYAIPYWITGGDKLSSLVGIILMMTAASAAAAWAIAAFARGVLGPQADSRVWPWLVAALWFLGPLALLHSMNGLETGLYTFLIAATATFFGHVTARGGRYSGRDQAILGALCGLVFLARNDGAFFVAALFLVRFLHVQLSGQLDFRAAVVEALPPGLISLAITAPWLVHNHVLFGSIVPISGTAQSATAAFGQNLPLVPVKLFETMFPMLPVPGSLELMPLPRLAGTAIVGAVLAVFLWRAVHRRNPFRVALLAYALYGAMLVAYYGLFFGAPHFLSRYLAPLAPLLITAAISVGLDLANRISGRGRDLAGLAGAAGLALSMALLVRLALPGTTTQGHFQVVQWVDENVDDATWVGAVQTGTLGYWHDRTINLDGKVNPEALAARLAEGSVLGYVIESPIEVIADWAGVAVWAEMPNEAFRESFELVVADQQRNLAVLRRRADVPQD